MRSILVVTFALSILNFTVASPDSNPRVFHKRDLCSENDQVDCFDSCMPPSGVCCSDGSGTYCPSGEYCVPNGCCPTGEECSGPGGTITNNDLTGTGDLPTATTAPVSNTGIHNNPSAVQASPTTMTAPTTFGQATTNPITFNAHTSHTTAAVVTFQATTSTASPAKGSGNAVSALSDGLERYALLLIAGGQLLLGW